MADQLPSHLQGLVDEMPEGYDLQDKVVIFGRNLIRCWREADKPEEERREYRYWLTATGNEVDVEFYYLTSQKGILVGHCDPWGSQGRILGRDPSRVRQRFMIWHGVSRGFANNTGFYNDLVVKDMNQPAWVPYVRRGGSYDTWLRDNGQGQARPSSKNQSQYH
jgi:hypothetical protein